LRRRKRHKGATHVFDANKSRSYEEKIQNIIITNNNRIVELRKEIVSLAKKLYEIIASK